MSKTAILEELPTLTAEDRHDIRIRLAELDQDEWLDEGELTVADKRVIEDRVADLERNPAASIPWAVAEGRLTSRFGK